MQRFILFLLLTAWLPLNAQVSLFDSLHRYDQPVRIELETDWKKLMRRKADKAYQPFKLRLHGMGEEILEFPGRIRPRGHIRLEVCTNPSLKIKLKKEVLRRAGFSDLNDLKLVLQCSGSEVGKGYHRREKLAYQLHAVFSENTHRIVPLQLTLPKKKATTIDAFLIEDEEQIAARYNSEIVKAKRLSANGLQREAYVNMCLFNYLILNTDWAVFNLHNVEFINPEGSLDLIPIPYDFDYSGFVGAGYAVPQEQLNINSIYEPKWLGRDIITPEDMLAGAAHYRAKKGAATALLQNYPGLTSTSRRRLLKRMEDFYKILDQEKHLLRLLE